MGNSGRFFAEESQPRQSRATQPQSIPNLMSAVFVCEYTTGGDAYSFTTVGYGIFNVRTHLGVCRTHEEGYQGKGMGGGGEGAGAGRNKYYYVCTKS